jgi:hypothetical protein
MSSIFYDEMIQSAIACASECGHTVNECLQSNALEKIKHCILAVLDCADTCHTLVRLLGRNSQFVLEMLLFTAKVSDHTADTLEKYKEESSCVRAANVARECATKCRNFAVT